MLLNVQVNTLAHHRSYSSLSHRKVIFNNQGSFDRDQSTPNWTCSGLHWRSWTLTGQTSLADGTPKLSGRERSPNVLQRGNNLQEKKISEKNFREIWRNLNQETHMMTQKPASLWVNRRRFHLSSSRRTSSSTVRAEREKHSEFNVKRTTRVARKPYWRPLECRCGSMFVRFHRQHSWS